MLLYLDDKFALHNTGTHPECIARITQLNETLRTAGVTDHANCVQWSDASLEQLGKAHQSDYLEQLQNWCREEAGQIEADTVVSRDSWNVALRGAGAAVDAVRRVVLGEDKTAFCAIRPPGHHAIPSGAMGFCLVNNIAIAAHAALGMDLQRVMIIDWDVHHGNGTQDIFYEDGRVGFYSIHRSPFYPGTGAVEETGSGAGLSCILNEPVTATISQKDFHDRFQRGIEDLARRIQPELILLSAGFDAHRLDPVGALSLEENDFETLTQRVQTLADHYCDGKLVSLLEGGYHLEHMPSSALAHVNVLLE